MERKFKTQKAKLIKITTKTRTRSVDGVKRHPLMKARKRDVRPQVK